jgi:hypothetical protein
MTNLYQKTLYDCKQQSESYVISQQKINCEHWFVDESSCTTNCSLNVVNNPTAINCNSCSQRKPVAEVLVDITKENKPIEVKYPEPLGTPSFTQKTIMYSTVEGSQFFGGRVSNRVYKKRKSICMGCPRRMNPTPDKEEVGWCTTCSCGTKNPRAALSNKLWMPKAYCPLKKFGPESGNGFNIKDAMNSVKGFVQSVKNLFNHNKND